MKVSTLHQSAVGFPLTKYADNNRIRFALKSVVAAGSRTALKARLASTTPVSPDVPPLPIALVSASNSTVHSVAVSRTYRARGKTRARFASTLPAMVVP